MTNGTGPHDDEPIDGLINYDSIESREEFDKTFTMSLNQLHHIWSVHWEIAPDSAKDMIEIVADMMKAFGATYHRLIQQGKIPPELQYHAIKDGRIKDIHENQ